MTFNRSDWRQFLSELPWEDFRWWLAYYQVEPWGEVRADLREGIAACGIANVVVASKGVKTRLDLKMFMPQFGGARDGSVSKRPMSVEEWQAQMGPWKLLAERERERKRRLKKAAGEAIGK